MCESDIDPIAALVVLLGMLLLAAFIVWVIKDSNDD